VEAALWLFSTAVQGDASAQKQGLAALPDVVRLLDTGGYLPFPFMRSQVANQACYIVTAQKFSREHHVILGSMALSS
jgi:hypothetical protein